MRLIRYAFDGQIRMGALIDDDTVAELRGPQFGSKERTGVTHALAAVDILPAVTPSKIIGVGLNYAAHAAEHHRELPPVPKFFFKPPSALIGDGDVIQLPNPTNHVNEEAELVVVIGARARHITVDEAPAYIYGYMCGNDVSDRDVQEMDKNWTARAKGYDTFAPIGPYIEDDFDPADAKIVATINDRVVQSGSTRDMVFDVPTLVSFASGAYTLEPGDLIFTGTPPGVSPMVPGDRVAVTIEGIGTLVNPVA